MENGRTVFSYELFVFWKLWKKSKIVNPDAFPKYLNDPSLLYRISYQELKTLVVQYPYCQNLRYLLYIKSRIDNNNDQDRNLKMAAAYSLDRSNLYEILQKKHAREENEIEFLDLKHNTETDPVLDLPVLDFTTGLEKEIKKKENISPIPPLELAIGSDKDSEIQDLDDLFEEAEDELIEEGNASADETESVIPAKVLILPVVPPKVEPSLVKKTTKEEPSEKIEKEKPPVLLYPPIPPLVEYRRWVPSEIVTKKNDPIPELFFPMIPPSIDYSFLKQGFQVHVEEQVPPAFRKLFDLPIIPPMEFPRRELSENEATIEVFSHEDEIDQGIKEALDRLILEQENQKTESDNELVEEVSEEPTPPTKQGPMPKVSFSSWLKQTKAPTPSLNNPDEEQILEKSKIKDIDKVSKLEPLAKPSGKKKKKKKKKERKKKKTSTRVEKPLMKVVKAKEQEKLKEQLRKRKVFELAEESLREKEDIVSETLAKILIEQGRYKKALKMYKRLSLKFPEKSGYFAVRIEKINKKIKKK